MVCMEVLISHSIFSANLQGVVIKYNEPEEARIPKIRWRLYQFKGDETLRTLFSVYIFMLFSDISIAIYSHPLHSPSECLPCRKRKKSKQWIIIMVYSLIPMLPNLSNVSACNIDKLGTRLMMYVSTLDNE